MTNLFVVQPSRTVSKNEPTPVGDATESGTTIGSVQNVASATVAITTLR